MKSNNIAVLLQKIYFEINRLLTKMTNVMIFKKYTTEICSIILKQIL